MAASDAKPNIYGNNSVNIAFYVAVATPSDSNYQPFKGIFVLATATNNVTIMDWGGTSTTLTSVATGQPIWVSGQRLMSTGTTSTVLLLQ